MKTFSNKDEMWIRNNFEKLVARHAGEYIAVAKGNIAFGKTRWEAEKKLFEKVKDILPSTIQIPHKESLTCAL